MTIKEAIEKGFIRLKSKKIDSPKLKARQLMQYTLDKPRQYLIVYDKKELPKEKKEEYFASIEKIENNIPLQHITHKQEFMKMDFFVNEHVLIPRPETESLVEEVIEISKKINAKKILDLCTGSGAIGISLAKYIDNSKITVSDISSEALKIAKKNAINNKVDNQIEFIESDLFEEIPKEKYDIIVSNPPYIKEDIIKTLDIQVQKEPIIALDGGKDGLDFYRKIIENAYEYLKYKGYLCLEIGYDQKEEVMKLIKEKDIYKETYSKKDLYGKDRIIVTRVTD